MRARFSCPSLCICSTLSKLAAFNYKDHALDADGTLTLYRWTSHGITEARSSCKTSDQRGNQLAPAILIKTIEAFLPGGYIHYDSKHTTDNPSSDLASILMGSPPVDRQRA